LIVAERIEFSWEADTSEAVDTVEPFVVYNPIEVDGATAVTAFSTAVITAVASLMF